MTTKIVTFNELTNTELYELLALRFNVFVIEQTCIYPEFDDIDAKALHLLAYENEALAGYARLYTDKDNYARIGRIVIDKGHRGNALGKNIIEESITYIKTSFNNDVIKINAQEHLKKYYESFGFQQIGDSYLDYGIPHIDMILNLS